MKSLDWNHIRAFHATATAGSLSAAARELGLTQPTLSRQVMALEDELGVVLFERVGRKLVLTETGTELLAHIKVMGEAADTVALAASGRGEQITGRVSISATDTYATFILPPIIERIRLEAPQLTIAIIASNELSNLHRREADIAIRHLGPDRPGLVGQHLRDTQADFYASDEWVARNGLPETPGDLAGVDLIGFDDAAQYAGYLQEIGFGVSEGEFRLMSSSSVAIWEMVRRGMGVAPMLREIASRTPGIVRLLPDAPPIEVPIWLVTHQELQAAPRIRLVHGILAEELRRL
ncbi:MAG: LysR family transcriptional regulator [Mesorhizobium sp.]|nr:LysR family transcriptional regulator [Mesorhizobium sp.]